MRLYFGNGANPNSPLDTNTAQAPNGLDESEAVSGNPSEIPVFQVCDVIPPSKYGEAVVGCSVLKLC